MSTLALPRNHLLVELKKMVISLSELISASEKPFRTMVWTMLELIDELIQILVAANHNIELRIDHWGELKS